MKASLFILAGLLMSLRCNGEVLFYASVDSSYPATISSSDDSLSASFTDVFGNQWDATASWPDFQDNSQITLQFSSPNPDANIGSGQIIAWDFYGFESFGSEVQGVKLLNPPYFPFPTQAPGVSYDENDVSRMLKKPCFGKLTLDFIGVFT